MNQLKDSIIQQHDFTEDLNEDLVKNITQEHIDNGIISPKLKLQRYSICKQCENLNNLKFCKKCNCFMPLKTLITISECPVGKW